MALSKSATPGSILTNLDDARKARAETFRGSTPAHQAKTGIENDGKSTLQQKTANQAGAPADSHLTDTNQKASNRRFDKVKVERIKAEIATGQYEINYLQVADKFIEHERYT